MVLATGVLFGLALILLRKRGWLPSFKCYMVFIVLCLFLMVSWVGPCSVIVALHGRAHLHFERKVQNIYVSQFKCALVY